LQQKWRGLRFAVPRGMQTLARLNDISYLIIQSAIEVHKTLAPGPSRVFTVRA